MKGLIRRSVFLALMGWLCIIAARGLSMKTVKTSTGLIVVVNKNEVVSADFSKVKDKDLEKAERELWEVSK